MPQLITSLTSLATGQAPVIVQVHGSRGVDLIAVAIGAFLTLGLLFALGGTWLLLRRHTDTTRGGTRR